MSTRPRNRLLQDLAPWALGRAPEVAVDALEINRTFDLISLAGQDSRLHREGKYHVGPCPFCGGIDRFVLKRTSKGFRWYCRKCGDGQYHTAIDYVMRREHIDFQTALDWLAGGNLGRMIPGTGSEPVRPHLALPDAAWQSSAWHEVDEASDRLFENQLGQLGRDYLMQRGLHKGTWYAWHLGLGQAFDPRLGRPRPAIVLPWFDADQSSDAITAIKYRFIDDQPQGLRYLARRGSVPIVFGLWDALPKHHTLLLVEGEINALSAWQCLPAGVCCASFGSEAGVRTEVLRAFASRYNRVFVWADDPKKTGEFRAALGRRAQGLRSPQINNEKWDANRLLQAGIIDSFLSEILGVPCLGKV